MKAKLKLLLLFILMVGVIGVPSNASSMNLNCQFDKHIVVDISDRSVSTLVKAMARLSIVAGKTTQSTLAMDGKERATNSVEWQRANSSEQNRIFVGDSGDLLTVWLGEKDGYLPASLQFSTLRYAYTYLGKCEAN